jgi:hypothetical protein
VGVSKALQPTPVGAFSFVESRVGFRMSFHPGWLSRSVGRPRKQNPNNMRRHLDIQSFIVIAVTLILFAVALVVKGFTHDLLLEAGVFLVSLKLIMMAYKNSITGKSVEEKLDSIAETLCRLEKEGKLPNQALQPTPGSVTAAAGQPPRQPPSSAELGR